ncbi:MAG: (2Fe-2S)-binding protein [Rhodovibrionaceae bacterium]
MSQAVALKINGVERQVLAGATQTLLEVLRDQLGLTGSKRGCNQGVCGACTVMVDGRPVRGCLSLAANCEGSEITTVEGLAPAGKLTPVQQALIDSGAVQCGFCTSGMVISAHWLLQRNEKPDSDEIRRTLSGNLCRCSGYRKIVEAVASAVEGGKA